MATSRIRCAASVVALCAATLLCGSVAAGYKAGTYQAQAQGMNGSVPVTVTFSDTWTKSCNQFCAKVAKFGEPTTMQSLHTTKVGASSFDD